MGTRRKAPKRKTPAKKATKKATKAAKPRAAARPRAAPTRGNLWTAPPAADATVALYDLVCPDEGRLESGLDFAACMARARQHNEANPAHLADCYQQAPQG